MTEHTPPSYPPALAPQARAIIESFEGAGVRGHPKGASRTIQLINAALCAQAEHTLAGSGAELIAELRALATYVVATRGRLSPAIGNALAQVLSPLDSLEAAASLEQARAAIAQAVATYQRQAEEHIRAVCTTGANLLRDGQTVLAYDYSSTVVGVLARAAEQGKRLHAIVPESRALNGGLPIVRAALAAGHQVTYTVDAAIARELAHCDLALAGAESLTATGGFWNTVGTHQLAILAQYAHVPLYVPTELIKFDPRSRVGILREVRRVPLAFLRELDPALDGAGVAVVRDDLEYTPATLVAGYITERGVVAPAAVGQLAQA